VDLATAPFAHLQDLTVSIGEDDQDLDDTLGALTAALRSTASSYCGFQLTIVENQCPVTLAVFTDGPDIPVGTSLRFPLKLVSPVVDPESRAVIFAITPGAFTDLAADLSYALGGVPVEQTPAADSRDHRGTHVDGQRRAIELDADLPLLSRKSGLAGLAELTVLNRAIGTLVDQGHDIEQAHQLLVRDAAAAGVEPYVYAARIFDGEPTEIRRHA